MNKLFAEVVFTRFPARILIVLCSLGAAVLGLLGPFFQKEFVDRLTGAEGHLHLWRFESPLVYILLAFLALIAGQSLYQITSYLAVKESLLMQRIFAKRVYDKTLHLQVDTMSGKPVGEIVSLYATDVQGSTVFLDQTLPAGTATFFPLLLAPFAIGMLFDVPLWPTVLTMAFIVVFNTLMALRQSRFFFKFKQLAAERIGLVNEWIQNIRTIRILGWIRHFEKNIFAKRTQETTNRVHMVTNGQVMNSVSSSITFLLNVIALSSLVFWSNHQATSGEILALLWILSGFLTRPFRQMPWFFTFAFDSWTSLKRLEDFFSLKNNQTETTETAVDKAALQRDKKYSVQVHGLNLSVGKRKILKDIDFSIEHGEFVAIVGEVGAGKSMLLLSLLRETGASFDTYRLGDKDALEAPIDEVREHFSYVPQEGFIMNASLRENVAFIYDIEADRDPLVEESLKLAQFDLSAEKVESGLNTEIGERGVNLSGGQRQRVGLARVHYQRSSILLLDDCLSAVDVDTEQKLFETLLLGAWKEHTRILVTHRLSALHRVDRILFMEDGKILDDGSFEELLARNPKFREYTTSVAQEATERKDKVGYVES